MLDGFVPVPEAGSFIGHLGGIHWRWAADRVDTCLVVESRHANPIGTVHGGVLMTLLDITLGATAQARLGGPDGDHPATVQLSCSFLAGARQGELLQGEATVDRATATLTFVSGRIHVAGRAVLTGSAVFRNPRSRP